VVFLWSTELLTGRKALNRLGSIGARVPVYLSKCFIFFAFASSWVVSPFFPPSTDSRTGAYTQQHLSSVGPGRICGNDDERASRAASQNIKFGGPDLLFYLNCQFFLIVIGRADETRAPLVTVHSGIPSGFWSCPILQPWWSGWLRRSGIARCLEKGSARSMFFLCVT